jgi:hypothetical protein
MNLKRFLVRLALWLVPAAAVWALATPLYNRFLIASAENLLHLVESPDVTDLSPAAEDRHYARLTRLDFVPADHARYSRSFRVTDIHFHLVLLAVLFLAVPGVDRRRRLENLGWALLVAVFFHILLACAWVEFFYTTQMGSFSLEHYGAVARNVFGLAKHLLDLPFKLAFPLVLWTAFYFRLLLPARPAST